MSTSRSIRSIMTPPTTIPPTMIPTVAAKKPGWCRRIFSACLERIARCADDYAAAVHLHALEDWALRDVGLERADIEAAVHGALPTLSRK